MKKHVLPWVWLLKFCNCGGGREPESFVILGFDLGVITKGRARKDITEEQNYRISVILNIHATLRLVFLNPANQHGFMRMRNNNTFFNGRTPLEIIKSGDLNALHETWHRIKSLEQPM
ncbi:hypothetical protein EF096_19395 [Pseudomonas neustonica]|uniref:DUF2384 domain-containing protein n=1 Tax=Pseudomonas neustonica TaxID=2487346 RepID=A0ABX9XF65_9PSED|nr:MULTISPECIES: hypothetical protein [Pseudomonas]ROZ79956.1 hypothetical protein EF099_19525 [Pseudomonas sp. SSM44]ROZ80533.1 hypothetical protein EF096_19395 [Pseudomonas neustonica]|tara:strand:+ start:496 stop:849 length:354 start_codon:yes stop_codon:yes gene_type:complete